MVAASHGRRRAIGADVGDATVPLVEVHFLHEVGYHSNIFICRRLIERARVNPELTADHPHHAAAHCLNCGTAVDGNYCHHCGQETVLHRPSAREFLHEFIGHHVALEGKLLGTLGRLLFRPGALTVEYLAGRRVRFVQPLRLYLTLSVLFFAVMKFSGAGLPSGTPEAAPKHKAEQQAQPSAGQPGSLEMPRPPERPKMPEADDDDIHVGLGKLEWLHQTWPSAAAALDHFNTLHAQEQSRVINEGFYHWAPTAMFCLMPIFALYLKVLYLGKGRRYGEHLLFALHSNAFAFAMFICMAVCHIGLISFVLRLWLIGYLPWAMRRVYGLGRYATFWRWSLLMLGYSLTMAVVLMLTVTAGVLTAE